MLSEHYVLRYKSETQNNNMLFFHNSIILKSGMSFVFFFELCGCVLGSVLKVQAVFSHIKAFSGALIQALFCVVSFLMSLISQIPGIHPVSYVPQSNQQLKVPSC